jgi:hypothetical protein
MGQAVSRLGRSLRAVALAALATTALTTEAAAGPFYLVTFNDPGNLGLAYYSSIETHALAAGSIWSEHLLGDAILEVEISFSDLVPTASGRSLTTEFVATDGAYNVFEQGATGELRTGVDPNGDTPDIEIVLNPYYLGSLWFDPNPYARVESVPVDQIDAVSVFLHEFGHAFGFNGWRDGFDGSLSGNFMSTFDQLTVFDGSNLWFTGAQAGDVYGGPVPVTLGNYGHVGNLSPGPGEDLLPDLMNGIVLFYGGRYEITELDLAMLADLNVPLREDEVAEAPEPSTLALFVAAGLGLAVARRRRT